MNIELMKGQRINLPDQSGTLTVETNWDVSQNKDQFDIDTVLFLLNRENQAREEDFIFYNNPESADAVRLSAVDLQTQQAVIRLDRLPEHVEKIVVVMAIYEPDRTKLTFSGVNGLRLKVCGNDGTEIFSYHIRDSLTVETALVLCEIYSYQGQWKARAVGAGYQSGLRALCELYGVAVI